MTNTTDHHDRVPWLSPYITVQDVDKAAQFYASVFDFDIIGLAPGEDGTNWHGELQYKDQLLMIGKENAWDTTSKAPATSKTESPMSLYLLCEDVDQFYQAAIAAGAKSILAPEDMFWGHRMCKLLDPDGYVWSFATPQEQPHHHCEHC